MQLDESYLEDNEKLKPFLSDGYRIKNFSICEQKEEYIFVLMLLEKS